jgi:hypothetical protein
MRVINIVRNLIAGSHRALPSIASTPKGRRDAPPALFIERFANQSDFQKHRAWANEKIAARRQSERKLTSSEPQFKTSGFCFVCQRWTEFVSSWDFAYPVHGRLQVNWREQLFCPNCRLNNRMRASVHLLAQIVGPSRKSRIYATEQSTPLYRYLSKHFSFLQGSEYLRDAALIAKSDSVQVRHEDLTRLTFPSGNFDIILSFDVLEHIPDYRAAFAECARVLKPTGKMLFSVPFDANAASNQIRARLGQDGVIEHLLPPEYHCDPRNPEGCLCFQRFGWEMFGQLQQAGFHNVWALCYYSLDYAYLGSEQLQFLAEK